MRKLQRQLKLSGHACHVKRRLEFTILLIYHSEIGVPTVFKGEVLVHSTGKVQRMSQASQLSPWITWGWLTKSRMLTRIPRLC